VITYSFYTTKNPTIQAIVQAIESAFQGLKIDTFPPNPFPTQNTQVQVHGYAGISSSPNETNITVAFFESTSEWDGSEITLNNITVDFISAVY
jgi:hypothetical protein